MEKVESIIETRVWGEIHDRMYKQVNRLVYRQSWDEVWFGVSDHVYGQVNVQVTDQIANER